MKTNFYEVTRSIYGSETSNMQPIAFGYVPQKKRGANRDTNKNNASRGGENRGSRGSMYLSSQAMQNG